MFIRKMEEADLPACARILCSVYNNPLWQGGWTEDTALAYLSDFFTMRKFVGWVVQDAEQILGGMFAHEKVWWNNSEVFVEEMFIHPQHQHRGYGSRLMEQLEGYVAQHKLAGITLSTNRYAPAPAFYRKHGFVDCGHVLFMAKEMPQEKGSVPDDIVAKKMAAQKTVHWDNLFPSPEREVEKDVVPE